MGLTLPTEPLMFGIMLIFIIKLIYDRKYDKKIITHPVTIAIIINLVWIFITTLTSELPVVSTKFLIARLWFICPAFFLGVPLFKKFKNIRTFIWLYIISLIAVIFYTIYNHSLFNFSEKTSHWVMTPFYNDHTAYGAVLALFIPIVIFFSFNSHYKKSIRILSCVVLTILIIAIVLSYTRAAWVSLIIGLIIFLIVLFRIKLKWVLLLLIFLISTLFFFQDAIFSKLEKNKQASSTDLVQHVESVSNISTDASNLERINRWNAAIRMFCKKPFFGWGPGTYQFFYGPFQLAKYKTIISTNAGDRGNAHSEYIGPLAESGLLGVLSFLSIIVCTIYTSLKIYRESEEKYVKRFSLAIIIGLITYFIHGFLNNFLDSDKASIPFWGFIAMIVAMDIYHTNKKEIKE